jgi:succinyl-diaminopimelate desuccinylase
MIFDNHPTLCLLKELIRFPSITPDDAGAQAFIAARLKTLGFIIEHLPFGDVKNLWAKRGEQTPLFVFAGHTDVVPTGPLQDWRTPPFEPAMIDGFLYGRGTADMKSSIAAMMVACERFLEKYPEHVGSIAFLLTSDEEGPAINGTRKVVEYLEDKGETITWCVVGEPSSDQQVGDTIKIGRRGSLNARLTIAGKQGHIAYPQLAENPIHACLSALSALCQESWDAGHESFPPTCFQMSNIHAGTGVTNVIPGSLEVVFNFRYSPAVTVDELKARVVTILQQSHLRYTLEWSHSGAPFLTPQGRLLEATQTAIQKTNGLKPILSTDGGTSDGRFIAPLGCELLELGLCNATIHQVNECIKVADLIQLTDIYEQLLIQLFAGDT